MTITEIMNEIYKSGTQKEIFDILYKWLMNDIKKLEFKNADLEACKTAIKKINAAKFKDEAIDALCE